MMLRLPQNALTRFGFAVLAVVIALLITLQIDFLHDKTPVYFIAVVLSTLFAGRSAGLSAILLSVPVAVFFTVPPIFTFKIDAEDFFQLATFVVVSIPLVILISALKQRELSLKASEARYRTLFEYAPEGILIADEKSYYLDANASICKMLGYTRSELIGLHASDILVKEEEAIVDTALEIIHSSKDYRSTLNFKRKDATTFPVEVIAAKMPDGNLLGVVRDLSERQHADERFKQIIEHAPYGKLLVDREARIQLVNAQIEQIFGYDRSELLGKNIEILVPSRFKEGHVSPRDNFLSAPSPSALGAERNLVGLRKDGTEFPVELALNPLKNDSGVLVLATVVDITHRKHAEEALKRSEEQFSGILNTAMDAIITVDEDQRVVLFNRSAERMFGIDAIEALNQPLGVFIPERYRKSHKKHIERFDQSKARHSRSMGEAGTLFGLRAGGEEFPIEASISQIESNGEKLYTVILRDVTERRRSEIAIQENEERTRLATEATGVGIWEWNILTNMIRWDVAMFRIHGIVPTEDGLVDYELWKGCVVSEDFDDQERMLKETVENLGDSSRSFRIIRQSDKQIRYIEAVDTVRMNAEGNPEWVVGTNLDVTDRKLAELLIRENEERLQAVTDNLTEGLVISDTEGNILHWNRAGLEMFGFEKLEDVLVKFTTFQPAFELSARDGSLLSPEEWPLNRVLRGEKLKEYEVNIRRTDKDWHRTLSYTGTIIKDASNHALAYLAINDITDRVKAEAAVLESESRFRTMSNSMPQLAWIADAQGHIYWYNQRWYDYTGRSSEEMEGWGWQSVHHPDMLSKVLERWKESIRTGEPFDMEFPILGVDGNFRTFLTRVEPYKDDKGNVIQWFGTNTDVDDLKRLETSLQETQLRLRSTLSAGSIGTWTWNIHQDNLIADEYTANVFSVDSADAARGLPASHYLRSVIEEDQAEVSKALQEAIDSCGTYDIEYRVKRPDDAILWIKARGRVEGDESGNAIHFHGAILDITERKLAEAAVSDLNEELEQRVAERTDELFAVNKELEAFSYSVSHDLRAPLRHIDGFVQLLNKREGNTLDDTSKRYLDVIAKAVGRMGLLIDELLAFSRTTRQELRMSEVDLDVLIQDARSILSEAALGRKIVWKISDLPKVLGDQTLLSLVVTNLVSNAIKYSRGKKEAIIEIGTFEKTDFQTTVYFKDNGAGFDMLYADKLFGVFQRLHREEEFEGIGIGLATVQRIIHRHGGCIRADGKVGNGATFYVTLNNSKGTINDK